MYGSCNVWVCVCVGFVMSGFADSCLCVLVIRVLVFIAIFYCFF